MKLRYLFLALIVLSVTSVFLGVSDITPLDLFSLTEDQAQTLMVSRIPRLLSILIAGMSMSICGLIMQQLSRNKFVSPTTAGTLDSARLGILVSMMIFTSASQFQQMIVAFMFALLGTFIFMRLLEKIRFKDAIFIPLVGLMFGNIISSISTFIAYQNDLIQNMTSWMQGDFSMIMSGNYELMFVSIPILILAFFYANKFTIAGMGEDFSKNLGLNYRQIVNLGLIITALVTASVVLSVGVIPFLGLIIPNIVTIYQGDHLKKSLLHTALLGAVFVLFCDVIGRVIIYPYEIPISLTVGVIGSGVFIYLLLRRKKYGF
ncbi:iron complex transport system permease protein [Virgibacillus natechei]|uniref:Iron complex transport system permease protein n=1 Tax=Virgibacillus natechei TaxID=1216297 RepID=A0ABS4ICE9_9BACI|nr:ABC transporter permease [Virgibacillus natechei]MBP1968528.1 iron complex transport system permease protein [Virgibacillus natechei]UZD13643.1 ABC transporter permease [Virgibacillus natechei]